MEGACHADLGCRSDLKSAESRPWERIIAGFRRVSDGRGLQRRHQAANWVFQWKYFPASVGNNVESDILGFFLLQQSPDEGGKTRNQLGRGLSVCFTLYVIYSFVPNTFIVVVQELEALK